MAQSKVQKRRNSTAQILAMALRMTIVAAMVLLQVALWWVIVRYLQNSAVPVYAVLEILSAAVSIVLVASEQDAAYRFAWVLVVLILGVFGLVLYLLWGRGTGRNALGKRIMEATRQRTLQMVPDEAALTALTEQCPTASRVAHYLHEQGFPLYQQTAVRFYSLGEQAFDAILADMEQAKTFIHIEFFIVFEGKIFERFFDVMARKAAAGVQVRLLYDDMGSLPTTTLAFLERLRSAGIEVQIFNPVHHYTHQLYLNYRDHRKIVAIDGQVAYTGGINIGDEYANLYPKHGHWKDTAVRLEGKGAYSLTAFFAQMWQAVTKAETPLPTPQPTPQAEAAGFVQPYEDGPHNNPDNPAQNVYEQVIYAAQKTVYMTTPYLVIGDVLLDALCTAARCGVDVRIVLPKIPDHWYVHLTSQSFYGGLLRAGVRVYEYTPGFIHAKMMVADGQLATVGTVNMDYRSFNLHYECGVLFCQGETPTTVQADIESVLAQSEEIDYGEWQNRKWYVKMAQPVLRLFAPLM